MSFAWSNRLSVGVPLIDRQHQELINHINGLLDAMRVGKGEQEIGRLLKFVEDYVGVHFGAEEKLMIQHKYPGFADHKAKHVEFVRDFGRLKEELKTSQTSTRPMLQIQRRVCDWTVQHIGGTDKVLGDFLKATV